MKKIILTVFLGWALANTAFAQCPRVEPGTGTNCVCPGDICVDPFGNPTLCDPCPVCSFCSPTALADVPIDQGVLILLLVGLGFGAKVVWSARQRGLLKATLRG